jgi:hypothetical protein
MTYISKEEKTAKAIALRALGKQYGVKLTVARRHHSTIELNIAAGKIDFFSEYQGEKGFYGENYLSVNTFYIDEHFTGESKAFLLKAFDILNNGNHNNSDIMIDYFDIGFYVDINIGKYNKPYQLTA